MIFPLFANAQKKTKKKEFVVWEGVRIYILFYLKLLEAH